MLKESTSTQGIRVVWPFSLLIILEQVEEVVGKPHSSKGATLMKHVRRGFRDRMEITNPKVIVAWRPDRH